MVDSIHTSSERLTAAWGISLPPAEKLLLLWISDAYPSGDWFQFNSAKMGAFAGIPAWKVFPTLNRLQKAGYLEVSLSRVRLL